jgi:hypothetical protein
VVGLVIAVVFERSAGETDAVPLAIDQTDAELRDASVDGFRAGMLVVAGLAFAGAAVGAVGISNAQAEVDGATAPTPAPAET